MRNYVIIGGSSGIGLKVANDLSQYGHAVHMYSRSKSSDLNTSVTHYKCDVLQDDILHDLSEVHGLVYCPGSINLKPFQSLSSQDFLDDFNINVLGAIKSIQAFLKVMKKTPGASIVLYSTVAVAQGMPFHASVAASKGAVEGLIKSLAAEFAPKIRVNGIAPSITDTPLAAKLLSNEEKKQKSGERHPLKRVGSVTDISSATTFLLLDQSSWITGQVLGVDGGMSTLKPL
ncbi:MAG: SDR family oxidoreductase [Bacteroidota bacterium]